MAMNPTLKAKWLEALRSGKYEQGTGALCKNTYVYGKKECQTRYCCLGVLADVMGANWTDLLDSDGQPSYNTARHCNFKSDGEYLSTEALKLAGLTHDQQETLAQMNDHESEGDNEDLDGNLIGDQDDYTFADIADQIEHHL